MAEDAWNYRVMLGLDGSVSIRLVTYNEEGLINGWNMIPVDMQADHIQDLWELYQIMAKAFVSPVIMERDLENQYLEAGKAAVPLDGESE